MLFSSLDYLWFFAVVFTAYWVIPWQRVRVWLLLCASFYFYAEWNRWLAVLICLTTTADYLLARAMDAVASPRLRKGLLIFSIVGNVGMLCYFKYANFFLESLEEALRAAGAEVSLPLLSVILPVGISFYTFEAINYMVDVYQRRIPAEKSLANLGLFILFFPHLVAGPIVRARDFLPQVKRVKRWSWLRAQLGVQYFLMGLFKKLVIADRMAMFADPVFADPAAYSTAAHWLALCAYALQIYGDFSGYSDMALGSAHLLGYKLTLNFNLPFVSRNITEFWTRWHISLSTWMRDYLFTPLGGARGSRLFAFRNQLITMVLCGLWHGASWNFVLWGLAHGLMLVGHRVYKDSTRNVGWLKQFRKTHLGIGLAIALTIFATSFSAVLFRTPSLWHAGEHVMRLFVPHSGLGNPLHISGFLATAAVVFVTHVLAYHGWDRWLLLRSPAPVLGFGYASVLAATLILFPDNNQAFIYFQF